MTVIPPLGIPPSGSRRSAASPAETAEAIRRGDRRALARAITLIEVAGERTEAVLRSLRGMAEVAAVHSTNGRWDLVVELATGTLEGFDAALQRIRQIRGVASTETSLLLTTHKV